MMIIARALMIMILFVAIATFILKGFKEDKELEDMED